MKDLKDICKVALVQAAPVMFDKKVGVEKTVKLIKEAGEKDVDLIVFPELFIPGYPYGITYGFTVGSRNEDGRKDWKVYYDNSIVVPGEETDILAKAAKEAHPDALVLAHPECPQTVLKQADYIGSTSGIIKYAQESDNKEFIICTECGVQYKLETTCPDKKFYFTETVPVCKNMKKVFLEKVLHVLKTGENEVHVTDETRENAKRPLERMLELAK